MRQTLKIAMIVCLLLAFGIAPSFAGKGGPKNTNGGPDGGGSSPPPTNISAGKVSGEAYSVDVGLTVDISDLLGLTIEDKAISLSTAPNTKIDLLGKTLLGLPVKVGTVTINEQITGGEGAKSSSITNNVLHVSISNPNILSLLIGGIVDGDIIVSSAHCGVAVNGQNGDEPHAETGGFVTGGGKIDSPSSFATFGFNARDGKGQLEYIDHGIGMTVHGDTVSSFTILDANCATFAGAASVDGQEVYSYTVDVCDYDEPGKNVDNFGIDLNNGYQNSGIITEGNIQQH